MLPALFTLAQDVAIPTLGDLMKIWPLGACLAILLALSIVAYRQIVMPWQDREDARTKAKREAAAEIARREAEREQARIEAEVRIAEAHKEMAVTMSETTKLTLASHEKCHAALEALKGVA